MTGASVIAGVGLVAVVVGTCEAAGRSVDRRQRRRGWRPGHPADSGMAVAGVAARLVVALAWAALLFAVPSMQLGTEQFQVLAFAAAVTVTAGGVWLVVADARQRRDQRRRARRMLAELAERPTAALQAERAAARKRPARRAGQAAGGER